MILPFRPASLGINLCEYSIIMTANVTEDRTITHSGPECISVAAILILNCLSPLSCSSTAAITFFQNAMAPTYTLHPTRPPPPFHKKETL